MTDAPDLSAEAVIDELREEALLLEQTAWSRMDGGQDWLLSATLATRAADILRTLSAENARLRADIAAAERKGAEGWQPIETAPHQTPVILCWEQRGVWAYDLGLASGGQNFTNGYSNRWFHGSATHWLPLPPAPTGHDDSGGV